MPKKQAHTAAGHSGGIVLTQEAYAKLTDLMDELAFRGPMQEALIMRVANAGGFSDVITRIKRRRLYTKKMQGGTPAGDEGQGGQPRKPRGKKKGSKSRRPLNPADPGSPQGGDTGDE